MPPKKISIQLEAFWELRGSVPDVPFAEGVNYDELVAADLAKGQKPMFVTLPLAQFGQVSRNRRRYSEAEVRRMYSRIMQSAVTGALGHLKDDERSYAFEVPAVKWVGALIEGKQLWGKLYVLSHREDLREYFRVQKASAGRVGTSLYSMGYEEYNPDSDVWEVSDLELEQIDVVHPDRVGVLFAATMTPHITTEMIKEAVNGELAVDDFVEFESDGILRKGEVNTIWTEGEVEVPHQEGLTVTASEEDPIARLYLWCPSYKDGYWMRQDWQVVRRFSQLTKIEPLLAAESTETEEETMEESMAVKPNTPSTVEETDVDSRIIQLNEAHQEAVRDLNKRIAQMESDNRAYARLREMLGVKEGQDPVLALQAQQSTLDVLRKENKELLETAVKQEVGKFVKVEWAQGMVESYVSNKNPQTRSDVVTFTQEALAQEHIATILRNAVQKEMGPNVETPTHTPTPTPVADDLIIIPSLDGSK
jgi:hypothetical protein